MAASPQFIDYVTEQLSATGRVTTRRMFGCIGFYIDGVFCAIVNGSNAFFLRTGPSNLDDYLAAGAAQFMESMPYYEVPEQVLEEPEHINLWVGKSRQAAVIANDAKKPRAKAAARKIKPR